ncbi:PaaI family thioesterase [Novosphingobium colocasiae]
MDIACSKRFRMAAHTTPWERSMAALSQPCWTAPAGIAAHTALPPGSSYTTLELKVSYMRALSNQSGTVKAIGHLLSLGKRAAFADARLYDGKGKLCATATSTLLISGSAAKS